MHVMRLDVIYLEIVNFLRKFKYVFVIGINKRGICYHPELGTKTKDYSVDKKIFFNRVSLLLNSGITVFL